MRLTNKEKSVLGKHTGHYFIYNNHANKESNVYIDKLGLVEDIEEKHNILSLDDLDSRLTALEIIKETLGINLYYSEETKQYIINIGGLVSYTLKGKEDFELLKKVLL